MNMDRNILVNLGSTDRVASSNRRAVLCLFDALEPVRIYIVVFHT